MNSINCHDLTDALPLQPGFGVAYIFHHFYLKATTCPRGTTDTSGCQLRNDRVSLPPFLLLLRCCYFSQDLSRLALRLPLCVQPLIDCAVCYKTLRDQIEPDPRPYVHCVHKTALTQVLPSLQSPSLHSAGGEQQ